MSELEHWFKALADVNRLRIINLLLHGELCGCDVQHVLDTPQPNVSRHLTYLKNAGLVLDRRDGYRVFYRLAESSKGARRPLFEFLSFMFKHDPLFQQDAQRLRHAISVGACTVSRWRPYAAFTKLRTASLRG